MICSNCCDYIVLQQPGLQDRWWSDSCWRWKLPHIDHPCLWPCQPCFGWSSLPIVFPDPSLYTGVRSSRFHCMPHNNHGAYNPMPLWPLIVCIIIKLAALCSALGEVYWCCGTQFVHCSRLASRQKAKLYPANTLAHLPASLQPTPPLEIQPSSKPLTSLAKNTSLNNLKNCLSLQYRRGAVIVRPCSQCWHEDDFFRSCWWF